MLINSNSIKRGRKCPDDNSNNHQEYQSSQPIIIIRSKKGTNNQVKKQLHWVRNWPWVKKKDGLLKCKVMKREEHKSTVFRSKCRFKRISRLVVVVLQIKSSNFLRTMNNNWKLPQSKYKPLKIINTLTAESKFKGLNCPLRYRLICRKSLKMRRVSTTSQTSLTIRQIFYLPARTLSFQIIRDWMPPCRWTSYQVPVVTTRANNLI